MKKNIIIALAAATLLSACQDSFLERYPEGGTIRQDQFEKLSDQLEGSVRGFYTKIYSMGGSAHDEFGKRSIDLWGDILCCDIALTGKTYGWLYTDEQMLTNGRTGTIWNHYYSQIHNINPTLQAFKNSQTLMDTLNIYAVDSQRHWPSKGYESSYTEADYDNAVQLAQAYGLRGYIYAQLAKFYTPTQSAETFKGYTIDTYKCCPVYTELNMDSPQGLSTSAEVYQQAFTDLELAIKLYDEFGKDFTRPSKLVLDREVISGIAAQAYLNESVYRVSDREKYKAHLDKAIAFANSVISCGKYHVLTPAEVLTTGFNNVDNNNWMWGQKVTVETSGGLKSWFGQVDIHSYSYAWAGDTKVIDANLYKEIGYWDLRRQWFRDQNGKLNRIEKVNSTYKYCPDGKYYSALNPSSTSEDDIDRDWLSDNVFMRIEAMYLIAAEASWRLKDAGEDQDAAALAYIREITDNRVIDGIIPEYGNITGAEDYADELATLTSHDAIGQYILYNWRLEMWGEGYGLETLRRWEHKRTRGSNHDYAGGVAVDPSKSNYNFQMPTSESTYNPNVKTKTLP